MMLKINVISDFISKIKKYFKHVFINEFGGFG